MLDYFKFLLTSPLVKTPVLKQIQDLFLVDETAYKVLINTLLDTEVEAFVAHLSDHKLELYTSEMDTALDVATLDQNLSKFSGYIATPELRNIAVRHFSPIWRVAAFVAFYILETDKIYNKRASADLN
jgi:hypothetical protein